MDTKYNFEENGDRIVYVRPVPVDTLPREVQDQADGIDTVYAVHRANGVPVAFVANRRQAFQLARENDLQPVSVH